jgi:hypothetical protein
MMRLYVLVLLSFTGLNPVVANAGAMVGDWYLEDTEDASVESRRAITQPAVQSLEGNEVTLGIKSPGSVDPVDFLVIVSGDTPNSGCTYTVSEIAIDAATFPVSSSAHSSDISQITTRLADAQKRLWRAFRKGRNLSLSLRQVCGDQSVPANAVTTHVFSLKGSSAAYRFVSGEEIISKPAPSPMKAEKPVSHTKTEEAGPTRADDPDFKVFLPWLVVLIIVVFIARFVKRRLKPSSVDAALGPARERSEPESGDYSNLGRADVSARREPQISPGTSGDLILDAEQAVEHQNDGVRPYN